MIILHQRGASAAAGQSVQSSQCAACQYSCQQEQASWWHPLHFFTALRGRRRVSCVRYTKAESSEGIQIVSWGVFEGVGGLHLCGWCGEGVGRGAMEAAANCHCAADEPHASHTLNPKSQAHRGSALGGEGEDCARRRWRERDATGEEDAIQQQTTLRLVDGIRVCLDAGALSHGDSPLFAAHSSGLIASPHPLSLNGASCFFPMASMCFGDWDFPTCDATHSILPIAMTCFPA